MSATVSVLVGNKKESVKVTPATTLAQVVNDACARYGLPPANYRLVYNNKDLDLSLNWRLSGLSSGALLEVKLRTSKAIGNVTIGLQLPTGERHQAQFPANTTLWDVLKAFESTKGINLTATSGAPPPEKKKGAPPPRQVYLQPCINFMNTEISTNKDLKSTTLQLLGLSSGSGLLRVVHRYSEHTLEEIQKQEKEAAELAAATAASAALSQSQQQPQLQQSQSQPQQELSPALSQSQPQLQQSQPQPQQPQPQPQPQSQPQQSPQPQAASQSQPQSPPPSEPQPEPQPTDVEQNPSQPTSSEAAPMEVDTQQPQPPQPMEATQTTTTTNTTTTATTTSATPMERDEGENQPQKKEPCPRDMRVFGPSDTEFDPSKIELPDDFFDLTQDDYARLSRAEKEKKQREEKQGSILRTKDMRERERLQHYAHFKKTLVRIRFPDRVELQGTFYPHDTNADLYAFVKENLSSPDEPFYLYVTPPPTKLKDMSLSFLKQKMVPASIVLFSWHDKKCTTYPFLKGELLQSFEDKLKDFKFPAQIPESETTTTTTATDTPPKDGGDPDKKPKKDKDKDGSFKVPAWFSAGQKKR